MLAAATLFTLFTLPLLLASPELPGDTGGGRGQTSVIVVKSAGVRAVQEVADAFTDSCRVVVQQLNVGEGGAEQVRTRELIQTARVLVAVGQPALDLLAGTRAQIVYALAPDPPRGAIGVNSSAAPYVVFRTIKELRPSTRRIIAISRDFREHGNPRLALARAAARSLGLELVERTAADSQEAIRALRKLFLTPVDDADGPPPTLPGDALWLGADPQLIDTVVLQFVLQLQLQSQIPVLAATRQQVSFGALLAVDWPLESVGRHLAWQVNQLLDDPDHIDLVAKDHPGGSPEVVINAQTARRLSLLGLVQRRSPGWKMIER
jgi:ABC-type uncharacterized transport system substrate-binding protein